ncbi:serine hydrolase domain-containing protein [Temperatibacter marinus]|uniref:Serine hydrolase domain-containing protein n=1 Tax=Temperatibacter marinus TaxID=1456591 RepID=A0AA52EL77_9PROT|nr:serine hydrolase domain-containing protein [Temperatibacter marinus]WND04061.1 serine hydrolase domain-containing protein [Temperatibacter marinus]
MKKNKILVFWLRVAAAFVTIGSIYIFAPWEFALQYLSPLPDTIQEELDDAAQENVAGIIFYVQQGDKAAEKYAAGLHNRAEKIPARPDALFKIASIGKLYNASALTKLAASGKLNLDKTLADYLPEMAPRIDYADEITLRMMVQHRSGLPNYTDHPDFNWASKDQEVTKLFLDLPGNFKPGTDYSYSNTNYLLMTRIMSNVLGHSHHAFITSEILTPLGLKNTYFSVNEVNDNDLMSGYYVGYEEDFKHLDQGFVATAEDVGIFLRALNEGTFFSAEETALYASLYEYEHTGWVLGYYSIARFDKETDTVMIQFINTNGDDTVFLGDILFSRLKKIFHRGAHDS